MIHALQKSFVRVNTFTKRKKAAVKSGSTVNSCYVHECSKVTHVEPCNRLSTPPSINAWRGLFRNKFVVTWKINKGN